MPRGSKRRLFVRLIKDFILHPVIFIKKLKPRTIKNFFKTLKSEGTEGINYRLNNYIDSIHNHTEPIRIEELPTYKDITDYQPLTFKANPNPAVSIIIPVFNKFEYTYNCLKSVLNSSGDISYEVIIADDCSTDLTTRIEQIVFNVQVIKNKENLKFLKNCNNAASYAKGSYILFLNNDTQVQENWLASLVELIEKDNSIGMVGSKLVYADGKLQEAGGIIWNDASAWNYGNGCDPNDPEYNYVKEVDYISGASILIRKTLWEAIGGFDERYFPAYCEDSDIAFEIRKRGYKVVYQPASVVVHHEGISNGANINEGQKAYQVVNQKKFYDKWHNELKKHYPNGINVFQARDRSWNKPAILFIDHYVPHYDKDAGSRTVFQYLKLFVDNGFNVKFIGDNFYKHEPYTTTLQQMGIEVLYGVYYANNWKQWVRDNAKYLNYVFLNRPHISIKYIDFIKSNTNAKIIYYGHDLHFLREHREYMLTGNKDTLKSSEEWKKAELSLMRKANVVYYPSVVEEQEIKKIDNHINVKAIPAYLFENVKKVEYNINERKDLMFIGGFGHKPNVDAVEWLARDIFPFIHRMLPDIKIYILGSNPPDRIKALDSDYFKVVGYVSDDELSEYYKRCRISIVPLRYGAGIKGKVIEAMYNGIPVVTTSIGAEGIKDSEKVMIVEDNNEAFAHKVVDLYNDKKRLTDMSKNAYEYIEINYTFRNARSIINADFDFLLDNC